MKIKTKAHVHDFWISPNFYLASFFLWLGFIMFINTLPGSSIPGKGFFSQIAHFDKVVHFTEYFVMMFLLWNLITTSMDKLGSKNFPTRFLAFPYVFAIFDELMQIPVSGRTADPLDLIVDWFGATMVLVLAFLKFSVFKMK